MNSRKNVKTNQVDSDTQFFPPKYSSTPTLWSQNSQLRRKVHWEPSVSLESLLRGTTKKISFIDRVKGLCQNKKMPKGGLLRTPPPPRSEPPFPRLEAKDDEEEDSGLRRSPRFQPPKTARTPSKPPLIPDIQEGQEPEDTINQTHKVSDDNRNLNNIFGVNFNNLQGLDGSIHDGAAGGQNDLIGGEDKDQTRD